MTTLAILAVVALVATAAAPAALRWHDHTQTRRGLAGHTRDEDA